MIFFSTAECPTPDLPDNSSGAGADFRTARIVELHRTLSEGSGAKDDKTSRSAAEGDGENSTAKKSESGANS